jgi:ParB-like chromosome segregation protein Spo0J
MGQIMIKDTALDLFALPAHPDAARFPRMPDADLADLAEDIKVNGMSMPILVGLNDDGQPCILDGINRREACRVAGITAPAYNFASPDADTRALILGANLKRRHQSEGQRTMMVALIYPTRTQGKTSVNITEVGSVNSSRLAKARAVVRESDKLAQAVVTGVMSLEDAHKHCRERDTHRSTEAERERADLEGRQHRVAQLHDSDPDLAELVTQERISLEAAEGDAGRRRIDERKGRDGEYNVIDTLKHWGLAIESPQRVSHLVATLAKFGPSERPDLLGERRTLEVLVASLAQLISEFPHA